MWYLSQKHTSKWLVQHVTLLLSFHGRIFWRGEICETPFKSCSRSSSHPSKPTVHPALHRLSRTRPPHQIQPPPLQKPQKQEQTRNRLQRASSPTTHPPAMETPRQRPSQRATSQASSLASWVKVRCLTQAGLDFTEREDWPYIFWLYAIETAAYDFFVVVNQSKV